MKIPDGPNGFPTVSPSMLRTYGAGGFLLNEQEEPRGCPAQFKAKYVDQTVEKEFSYPLAYGSMVHDALYRMEDEAIGPEDALEKVFPANLGPDAYEEALDDLRGYLERGASPTDKYATIATESRLTALLYEDEEFGPIYMQGIVDWLGIDMDQANVLHVVDYKTNRTPPSEDDVRGDVQLKTYHWLVQENWETWIQSTSVKQVVVHLDAIKWRDVEVRFNRDDIEAWHSWAVAVVRHMLRDTEALPVLNEGCAYCPIRDGCSEFQALPDGAESLLETRPADRDDLVVWRDKANSMRLLLEKAVKDIDARFASDAEAKGEVFAGKYRWFVETKWAPRTDTRRLHELLGDRFYDVATVTKTALTAATKGMEPSDAATVLKCIRREPSGTKVTKEKV